MSRPSNVYRGKRKYNGLLTALAFLLILLLSTGIAVFFSLQKYIVYDKDGPSLFVPSLEGVSADSLFQPGDTDEVKSETPKFELPAGVEVSVSAPDFSETEVIANTSPGEIAGQYLSPERINVPTLEYFSLTDVKALMLDMKPSSGIMPHSTSVLLAISYGCGGDNNIKDKLTALKERDVYLSARVSILADAAMASRNPPLAIRNYAGTDIFNFNGMFYLDPYNEDVRSYISDILYEMDLLGFDEVVLSGFSLPAGVEISYSGEMTLLPDSVTALASLAFYIRDIADKLGIGVSVELETSALRSSAGLASVGQNLSLYSKIFDRVYFISDAGFVNFDLQTLESNFTEPGPGRIVPILDYVPKEGSYILMTSK